ncbi:MAG: aminopeptidase family protein P [Gammaproteobacteria bacterium]|nr:aminopeptidase family protein P [Gammaproteobacteria bacterium]
MNLPQKLEALRALMHTHQLDYYLAPGTDPHQSEYMPAMWQRRSFISEFDGSAGDVVIGLEKAYLWTDGRYELQAKNQLNPAHYDFFISAQGSDSSMNLFFAKQEAPVRLGVDPQLMSIAEAQNLEKCLKESGGSLVFIKENLIDLIEQPAAFKAQPICLLNLQYTGKPAEEKIKKLQQHLSHLQCDALVLSDLSCIAWLFNLRGEDIPYNPLFLSYALISPETCTLFLNSDSLNPELTEYLYQLNVEIDEYATFYHEYGQKNFKRLLLDPRKNNQALLTGTHFKQVYFDTSPIDHWKSCKNDAEISGAIEAHRIDALAVIQFLHWLKKNGIGKTECGIADKLLEFRQKNPQFKTPSFETIPGYADNGAIMHYHAHHGQDKTIGDQTLLLVDSGGQYLEGTTDITRTVHLGTPSTFEKECYTLVLKGHLALRNARFNHGTRGEHLDVLARQFLWKKGFNYGHGTGHGVGAYLCVHEGPQRISTAATTAPLLPGMIVSNEPGLYLSGRFGIRIENLLYIKTADIESEFGPFYEFEDLTLVPYAHQLIAIELLSFEEITQINQYHQKVWSTLYTHLEGDVLEWLKHETSPL